MQYVPPPGRRFSANAAVLLLALAAAACGSSGNTYTSPSGIQKCAVAFDAPSGVVPADGGTGAIPVKTERECGWTATPDVPWLSVTAGSPGQGNGTVEFAAAANGDPVARSGGIMLNGLRAQVTQAAAQCRYTLASSSASMSQAGGSGSVDLRASSSQCTWTAKSDVDWITITSGADGKGSATVTFNVAPTAGPPRTGTLTIAGLPFTVTQSEGCTYAIAPPAYAVGSAGGSSVVTVTAAAGCPWTASSAASWITLAAVSGTGSGTVGFTVAATTGPSRTGTLTIAGQVFTVTQSPGCAFDVSPLSHTVDASGGTRTVNVSAAAGCAWTATSGAPWITITAGASGSGAGTVTFAAAATSGPARTGTIAVGGQTVTVVQGQGCTFAISPDTRSVPASGGDGTVSVTAGAGCAWTAASNAPWLTIAAGASGSGNGSVSYKVAATSGPARSGALTIAGRIFTVNQGADCTISLSSSSSTAPAAGGTGTFDVRAADGCGWSAASNEPWLTVTAGATGQGNGAVRYAAAANTGPQRTGTITAGGQAFTVRQDAGCSYSLSSATQNVGSGGGNASVGVTAPAGCAWTAQSNAPWIGISTGSAGSGNGTVQLVIAANAEAERRGTVTIGGQTFTVVQASGCTFTIAPAGQTVPSAGGSGSFAVNTAGACAWTAATAASWISITSGSSGTAAGTVQFTAAANTGAARSGTIDAGGQTFTVTQDPGCSFAVAPDTIGAPAAAGSHNVNVTTAAECAWTAVSAVAWIAIPVGASGSGNGTVQLDVRANTGPARNGTATIAGRTVTVNQDSGCTFAIAPTSQAIPVAGGSGSVTVTAGAGCAWTAVSGVPWVTVTKGASGSGGETVEFAVEANATGAARAGAITIAGHTFTVEQAGAFAPLLD
jgi:hypothetical protein